MKITNLAGLPDPLVRAVSYSDRDVGDSDYTITELLTPPRIVALKRKHADELTEDAADRIWALMGSAAHEVLRRAADPDDGLVERRLFANVAGKRISGQVDYSPKLGAVFDYKFVSMWSIKEGVKREWVEQLNCYRFLLSENGEEIADNLEIIAILRDWSKSEARRNIDMPQQGVVVLPVNAWTMAETLYFLQDRIAMHEAAKTELPECTSEEMWERPGVWAVKKRGGSRAIPGGLCATEAEALAMAGNDRKLEVEYRPGVRPRCQSYCACSSVCVQYAEWLANGGAA